MTEIKKDRLAAFFMSAISTIVVIGTLTIANERYMSFNRFLTEVTGHHWVTKSILAMVLFPLLSLVFFKMLDPESVRKRVRSDDVLFWTVLTAIVASVFIAAVLAVLLAEYFGV